jgi:hypothetical protein
MKRAAFFFAASSESVSRRLEEEELSWIDEELLSLPENVSVSFVTTGTAADNNCKDANSALTKTTSKRDCAPCVSTNPSSPATPLSLTVCYL